MNRQIEENDSRARYIANEDFDLLAALRQKYSSFPERTKEVIDLMTKGDWFTPKGLARLGNRKKDTFNYVVYMANALQTGEWEQALDKFWNECAQTVSTVRLDTAGKLEGSFRLNMYIYVIALVVRPYDANFLQNHGRILDIHREALIRAGANPQRIDEISQRSQQANTPQNQQQVSGLQQNNNAPVSIVVTEEYLKRHLSKIKSKIDALASKMTKEALQNAQQDVDKTYAYCIGKTLGYLGEEYFTPYEDAIEGEWLSQEMLTYDKQELYVALYWALCVSSMFDPEYSAKYEKSLKRISK